MALAEGQVVALYVPTEDDEWACLGHGIANAVRNTGGTWTAPEVIENAVKIKGPEARLRT